MKTRKTARDPGAPASAAQTSLQSAPKSAKKRGRPPRIQIQPGSNQPRTAFNWSAWAWSRRVAKEEKEKEERIDGVGDTQTDGTDTVGATKQQDRSDDIDNSEKE